jgi:hypothetical protein
MSSCSASATALATNMHLYWTGLAGDLLRMGDSSCRWVLEEAAGGEIFAADPPGAARNGYIRSSQPEGGACLLAAQQ